MTNKPLFEPYDLGCLRLANRVVMAPPPRNRTSAQHAGLIITGATQISVQAQSYFCGGTKGYVDHPILADADTQYGQQELSPFTTQRENT